MENATKALLIAAAVLVAVLIISLGIVVYTKAAESVEGVGDLRELEIQQFNEKFLKYHGDNKSGSEVNSLLKIAFNHNNAQASTNTCVTVIQKNDDGSEKTIVEKSNEITAVPEKVDNGARYDVKCNINKKTKVIDIISIEEVTVTP